MRMPRGGLSCSNSDTVHRGCEIRCMLALGLRVLDLLALGGPEVRTYFVL